MASKTKPPIRRPAKECEDLIYRIVAHTAVLTGVSDSWTLLFKNTRGQPALATSRNICIAVCLSAGVPAKTVARVFSRTRQAIDAARQVQMRKLETDTWYRDTFFTVLIRATDTTVPAPELPKLKRQ